MLTPWNRASAARQPATATLKADSKATGARIWSVQRLPHGTRSRDIYLTRVTGAWSLGGFGFRGVRGPSCADVMPNKWKKTGWLAVSFGDVAVAELLGGSL